MGFLTKNHNQTIVYWASPSVSDKWGNRTFTAPVELSGRWEDRQDLFIDPSGRERVSRAVVFLGQDVDVGGYLYLGTLLSISSAVNPKSVTNAYEIRAFSKIPNLRSSDYERKVTL